MAVAQTETVTQTLGPIAMNNDSPAPQAKTNLKVVFGAMTLGKEGIHFVHSAHAIFQDAKTTPGAEGARIHTVEDVASVIDVLQQHGHNEIDTARVYGTSEALLGQLKWQHFESRPRRLIEFEIFENASRGPWGALDLLYHMHWRAIAGSTGAIITVLAVAMDPFAQQVIQFDSRPVTAHNETSVISAARSYDMNSRWESIAGVEFRESYSKPLRRQSLIEEVTH